LAFASVEDDDDTDRFRSACGTQEYAVVVSGFAAVRAFVWIAIMHRAFPTQITPSIPTIMRVSGQVN